ncbi:MAG TPA: 3-methyl-2-oxobutanoate hydroxymethyltransferase [Usitatibacter sp.]|nr:3-methyl-2-oxobutanoate hydroxymethyltransferase [Usitatibacter sp.]
MAAKVSVPALQAMKRGKKKIVGVVAWDFQIARIADRSGVDLVSVGDSVGMNLWGRTDPEDMTLDEMILVCRAVRLGVERALVSCDFPYGVLQQGVPAALAAARRVLKDGGADMVKLDDAAAFPEAVRAIADAGIPVFAQMGITQGNAAKYGIDHAKMLGGAIQVPEETAPRLVDEAKLLEASGAAMIDFTSSGPIAGALVAQAVTIPVVGGLGGGPWLDGRMRMAHAAIGYAASAIDAKPNTYANVAQITLDALTSYAEDVRGARQIRGGIAVKPQA